jgi:peptide/nickel transport system substrate-binding protein
MRKLFLITLFLICALILIGCSQSSSTTTSQTTSTTTTTTTSISTKTTVPTTSTSAAKKPVYGGSLKILNTEKQYNMGDIIGSGVPNDSCLRHLFFETLLRFDWREGHIGEIVPWLATSYKWNSDFTALTLTLQKGVKYHDGTDFNAQSVKACLERHITGLADLKIIQSIDIVDDFTIRLNTGKFQVSLVPLLAQCPASQMDSPANVAKYANDKEGLMLHPVGTGAFLCETNEPGVKVVGVKNPNYWAKDENGGALPYLDRIEWDYIADSTVAKMAFEKGEGDIIPRLDAKQGSELIASGKYNVFISPSGFEYVLGPDSKHPDSPFAKADVRKAVYYAIDVEGLVKDLGYGIWRANRGMWDTTHADWGPKNNPYKYDPAKAKELLKSAGYANGLDTTIYLRDATFQDATVIVQSYLRDVGINAKVEVMTAAVAAEQASSGWYGIRNLLAPNTPEKEPFSTTLSYYGPDQKNNNSMTVAQDIIDLCTAGRSEPDADKRHQMVQQLNDMFITRDCDFWGICNVPFVVPKQSWVHGDNLRFFVGHNNTPERAWVEPH